MLKIAHRGNVDGPNDRENEPDYLLDALARGYEIEVDVWVIAGTLWLGHDYAQYQVNYTFLSKIVDRTWFHCKNLEALYYFSSVLSSTKYFWHQEDDFTLTSNGYIWTYPGKEATTRSVIVDLDLANLGSYRDTAYAVCTDYPANVA